MKKKWAIIFLLICLVIAVGIGGKIILDNKKEKQEKELINVERQSVIALKEKFSNIKEVEINKSGHNPSTGSYRMFVTMTNLKNETVTFSYGFWNKNKEIGDIGIENPSIQTKGITGEKIKVIFTNGEVESL